MLELLREYKEYASLCKDYETLSITELADKYCEAMDIDDEYNKNIYFSTLILRFWYKIFKIHSKTRSLETELQDCCDWIASAILMACSIDNRAWQTNKKLNAQQVINQIIQSRFVAAAYYESNLLKNAGKRNRSSLDLTIDNEGRQTSLCDLLTDEKSIEADSAFYVKDILQDYIANDKIIEAIIVETIANNDVFKHEKHYVHEEDYDGNQKVYLQSFSTFKPSKVVQELNALDNTFAKRFLNTYKPSEKLFSAAFDFLVKATNQKKYSLIDATLKTLRLDFNKYTG